MKHTYYFSICEDNLDRINDRSTDGEVYLSCIIGHTLANFMEDKNNPLELVRINRGCGMQVIAIRRFNDIRVSINN